LLVNATAAVEELLWLVICRRDERYPTSSSRTQKTDSSWLYQPYVIDRLLYAEETEDVAAAIQREKEIKAWRREKKEALIESANPAWRDLSLDW